MLFFINWGLFIFNLIPLPPLDGSHLLFYPFRKFPAVYNSIYKYGSLLLFGIIIFSIVTKSNFIPIGNLIEFPGKGFPEFCRIQNLNFNSEDNSKRGGFESFSIFRIQNKGHKMRSLYFLIMVSLLSSFQTDKYQSMRMTMIKDRSLNEVLETH